MLKQIFIGLGVLLGLLVVLATALPTILHTAGLHPGSENAEGQPGQCQRDEYHKRCSET